MPPLPCSATLRTRCASFGSLDLSRNLPLILHALIHVDLVSYFHESLSWGSLAPLLLFQQVFAARLTFLRRVILLEIIWYNLFVIRLENFLIDTLELLKRVKVAWAARQYWRVPRGLVPPSFLFEFLRQYARLARQISHRIPTLILSDFFIIFPVSLR